MAKTADIGQMCIENCEKLAMALYRATVDKFQENKINIIVSKGHLLNLNGL